MKLCARCKSIKPINEFYAQAGKKDGVQAWCKKCNKESRTILTQKNRSVAIAFLGGKCINCGYNRYNGALHFHHRDSSLKDDMFHRLRNRKIDYILKTLSEQKIVLLCANCHVEEHHMEEEH